MERLLLFLSAAGTVLALLAWLRHKHLANQQTRQIKARMGIKGRWDDAFEIDDDELLLDPTLELPERRSMVLLVGDIFDASARGQKLRETLRAADIGFKPSEALGILLLIGLLSYIVAEVLLRQGPVVDSVIAIVCAVILPWLLLRSRRDRRLQNLTRQLPAVAELMSNALRAGLSLQSAMEFVAREIGGPASEEFGLVIREVRLGGNMDDALEGLVQRVPTADLEVMVTALKVQRLAGGNLIKSMAALSRTLSERQRTHEEVKTMMTQSIFASYLMPVLAVGALAMLNYTMPGFLDVLFNTIPGILILTVFIMLQVGGFMLIQRIARIKV